MATPKSQSSTSEPPPAHISHVKREQVLIACKVCRVRKTKCSGNRPNCEQCEIRNIVCNWEVPSDETPRAAKRKYRDLEQRSAGEHELLQYLRTLPEVDCLKLTRRLREGCLIDDLLNFGKELSERKSYEHIQVDIRLSKGTDGTTENDSSASLKLPPISSFWNSDESSNEPHHAPGRNPATLYQSRSEGSNLHDHRAPTTSLYDRFMSQV